MAPSLFDAYIAGGAREFFGAAAGDARDRRRAVERARRPLADNALALLRAQNARYGPSAARAEQLAALERGAVAVVTGQQVGLFLGPLFTVYKAASAIRVARALSEETGQRVVPIFWLQTEDHDLPEIASCAVPRAQQGPLSLAVPAPAENRVSIAHLALPAEVDACVAALRGELGNLPHAAEHLDRVARHYRAGAGWTEAFAGLLAELFEPEGLLLLDPRDAALAPQIKAVHQRALRDAPAIAQALLERGAALERAGFAQAVHVREAAPLSFVHGAGPAAARHRLAASAHGFDEIGGARTYDASALHALLEQQPLCFSTSALLRPILQDVVLPTAAYVGGPGEIAYFAQLAPVYAAFELPMPLIVPRARLRVIESGTARLLGKLGLRAADAARDERALLAQIAAAHAGPDAVLDSDGLQRALLAGFDRALDAALPAGALRDELASPIAKTRDNVARAAAKLAEKYGDALARGDQARVHDVQRLKALLHPNGAPQERFYGLPYFAARHGERAFLDAVLRAAEPFDFSIKELAL
jgi:bacillithiol biosynthesis cysteine-adding enzyme BshC